MPSANSVLAAGSGPEPRFPFQVSVLLTAMYCWELHFPRGGSRNNEPFIVFPLMKSDRVYLSFPSRSSGWPSCYCFSLGPTPGLASAFVLLPVSEVPRRRGRERIQAGQGGTDVSCPLASLAMSFRTS